MPALSIEQRKDILDREVLKYVRQGFRVASQSDTTASLVKPKNFSLFGCIFLLGLLYLPFYWAAKDKALYLSVDDQGKILRR